METFLSVFIMLGGPVLLAVGVLSFLFMVGRDQERGIR